MQSEDHWESEGGFSLPEEDLNKDKAEKVVVVEENETGFGPESYLTPREER